jgi:hypothetical protein
MFKYPARYPQLKSCQFQKIIVRHGSRIFQQQAFFKLATLVISYNSLNLARGVTSGSDSFYRGLWTDVSLSSHPPWCFVLMRSPYVITLKNHFINKMFSYVNSISIHMWCLIFLRILYIWQRYKILVSRHIFGMVFSFGFLPSS